MTRARDGARKRAATAQGLANTHSGTEIRVTTADDYMTRDQVAARWKLSPKTLSNWHHLGKGPRCFRLANGRYRYRTADVLAYEEHLLESA
ncbi:helix-turn-helix transcriptional regulator [Nocardia sp. NPDC088792]|uniref:helix-turn-helix transcriptional regulator n=1 Tax=Nocardia sp. NPDC088792 TaxID=3364332 RepID=UPI00382352F1